MAQNKNQHIIPQHYLRGFSKDRDDKSFKNAEKRICRYNLKEDVRPCVAIKNTCAGSYFYVTQDGFDEVDKVNKMFEDIHAPILEEVIKNRDLQSLNSDKIEVLYTFITLLYTRTENAREFAVEMEEKVCTEECQRLLEEMGDPDLKAEVAVEPLEAQFNMMKTFVLNSLYLSDLSHVLLINESEKHFITSDNPVILYNYKMIDKRCVTGAICSGLIILCPLTENLLLLFFDKYMYDIRMDKPSAVRVKKEIDIDSINKLQLVNCFEEIYFYDESELEYIKELRRSMKDYESNLMDISYKIRLSFLKLNKENNRRYKKIMRSHEKHNNPLPVARRELLTFRNNSSNN